MKNITLKISDKAYKDARIWASAHDTSVSALVQYCLEKLPNLQFTTACTMQMVREREQALAKAPGAQQLIAAAPAEKTPTDTKTN
jgi:hypothetical protein